jgi:hypothetical protein
VFAASSGLLGGPDLLIYLVLAFGGAMFVGNLMALLRPPNRRPKPGQRPAQKQTQKQTQQQTQQPVQKPVQQTAQKPAKRTAQRPTPGKQPSGTQRGVAKAGGPTPANQGPPLSKAPRGRTIAMATIGGFVSLWAVATLLMR